MTAEVRAADVSESGPGLAPSAYSNSRSSSLGHPKSDSKEDSSAPAIVRRCLWSEDHQIKFLEDIQCHFFGCVPFFERIKLLRDVESPDGFWHKAAELDLEQHPDVPWMDTKPKIEDKQQRAEFIRFLAVRGIRGERKRIRIIRSELDKDNDGRDGLAKDKNNVSADKNSPCADKKGLPDDSKGLSNGKDSPQGMSKRVTGSLVDCVTDSLQKWRTKGDKKTLKPEEAYSDSRFAEELRKIKHDYLDKYVRKNREETPQDCEIAKDSSSKPSKPYNLERDIKVHVLQFEPITRKTPVASSASASGEVDADEPELVGLMQPYQEPPEILWDEYYNKEQFPRQFPNQVISLKRFLKTEFRQTATNGHGTRQPQGGGEPRGGGGSPGGGDPGNGPGGGDDKSGQLAWFHLPYNNMEWVKQAVNGYFCKGDNAKKAADMVLHAERWTGQEYGSGTEAVVHARHLRALCDRFSTDFEKSYSDKRRNNMVLFMPYLHWETDRNRTRMAEAVRKRADRDTRENRNERWRYKCSKRKERRPPYEEHSPRPELPPRPTHTHPDHYRPPEPGADATPETVEGLFWERIRQEWANRKSSIMRGPRMGRGRRLLPTHPLGQLLIDAARLFEAIAAFQDDKVIEKYLFADPPLHPRRSLDQAYFWKLRSTCHRDRDQVVYRYTSPRFHHSFHVPDKGDDEAEVEQLVEKTRARARARARSGDRALDKGPNKCEWQWSGHGKFEDEHGCEECDAQIRKTARAVMVDQLWMWILDENTILTCFPKRYGVGKKDPSGVHHSIRRRLHDQTNSANNLRGAFDLGLIILEECFDTFFDRTTTEDMRPQIMDIFAESMGRVSYQQSIASRHLWQLAENKIHESATNRDGVTAESIIGLVTVLKESHLQREIRDIIDELDIIIHVVNQQEQVITKYMEQAVEILEKRSTEIYSPAKLFKKRAETLVGKLQAQIKELEGLKNSADSTAQNVTDLIDLKQQKASIVQAYQAMKQGEETMRQGKAIMLFTIMTIIFLPLSFMSSLFGMNAVELTGSSSGGGGDGDGNNSSSPPEPLQYQLTDFWPVTFVRQIIVMFSVSAVAVGIVIIPAFSPLFRAVIWSPLRLAAFFIAVRSPAYRFWLWLWDGLSADPDLDRPSEKIGRHFDRYIETMEVRVRRGRRARALWRGEQAEASHHV